MGADPVEGLLPITKKFCVETCDGAPVRIYKGGDSLSVHLGTVYEHIDYGGSSDPYYGVEGCNAQGTVQHWFDYVGDSWNDIISSAAGANGCWVRLYEHINWDGNYVDCTPSCPNLVNNNFNDVASSLVFY